MSAGAMTTGRARAASLVLAIGGFAIGTTEFVTMGILPQIAHSLGMTEPAAGHGISAYALGVVVGVPTLSILGARLPRRGFLVGLLGAYALFNALTTVSTSPEFFIAARFLAGLPHGAYFGLASTVAASLTTPQRRGRAVAGVLIGLSVANVVGVPGATWLVEHLGWQAAYLTTALIALVAVGLILAVVPVLPADRGTSGLGQARAFFASRQVWLTVAAAATGFGGMFAVYSYIATTVTDVGRLAAGTVPVFLLAFGLGQVTGNRLAGRLAAWSVLRTLLLSCTALVVMLLAFRAVIPYGWLALPVVFLITCASSMLVTNFQVRLMDVSAGAVTLGASMNQAALNVSNALGAWLGGLSIAAGFGYTAPALVGAGLSAVGLLFLVGSALDQRRRAGSLPAARRPEPSRA